MSWYWNAKVTRPPNDHWSPARGELSSRSWTDPAYDLIIGGLPAKGDKRLAGMAGRSVASGDEPVQRRRARIQDRDVSVAGPQPQLRGIELAREPLAVGAWHDAVACA